MKNILRHILDISYIDLQQKNVLKSRDIPCDGHLNTQFVHNYHDEVVTDVRCNYSSMLCPALLSAVFHSGEVLYGVVRRNTIQMY